jgi:polyhydroxyalkanoate synthase
MSPLPGPLVSEIVQLLYRENRFCRGTLTIRDQNLGPSSVRVPLLAIVNTADEVAPLNSVKPFLDEMPMKETRIIEYPGEAGIGLQHLALLAGPQAHARIWPEVVSWLRSPQ